MTIHKQTAVATFLLAMICVATTRAQQGGAPIYEFTAVEAQTAVLDRMEELEAEVASLRSQLLGGGDCGGCDGKGCGGCGMDGGKAGKGYDVCAPTVEFWTDMTLLRYHKTGGVHTGSDAYTDKNPEHLELGFIASPRLNLRLYRPNGMFVQGTFFQFNHSTVRAPDALRVNTYTFDIRFGDKFQLNENWWMEWTGGPRRFRYEESLLDDGGEFTFTRFKGVGGVVSLTAGRPISRGLVARLLNMEQTLFGGVVLAVAQGDQLIRENRGALTSNVRLSDVTSFHFEISTGTELVKTLANGGELFFRWGVEWVTFSDAGSQFGGSAPGVAMHENLVMPGADVGFGGFAASLGLRW